MFYAAVIQKYTPRSGSLHLHPFKIRTCHRPSLLQIHVLCHKRNEEILKFQYQISHHMSCVYKMSS